MSIKRAFSLVELLLVILIVSLSYGIIYSIALKADKKAPQDDKNKLIYFIETHPLYKKEKLWLFCNEQNRCYVGQLLGNRLQEVEIFQIETPYLSYTINQYSELIPFVFPNIRVNNFSFKPYIILETSKHGLIKSSFLEHNDKWYYYNNFEKKWQEEINQNDILVYAKKSNYFPYMAGDINDN